MCAAGVLIAAPGADRVPDLADSTGLSPASIADLLGALARMDAFGDRLLPACAPLGDLDPAAATALGHAGLPGVVLLSLEVAGSRVGVLVACFREADPDVRDALPLARHAALALALALGHRVDPPRLLPQVLAIHDLFDRFALASTSDEDLTRRLAQALARMLGVPMTALMIYDEDRDLLYMAPGSFGASDERVASYQIAAENSHSNSARVFVTGQPYLSNDAATDPGIRPDYVQAFSIQRLLSVPLVAGDRRIGVLHLANKDEDFTIDDLVRVEAIAPRVAAVVDLARTSLRLRREERLEGVLSAMALAIAAGKQLAAVLPPALRELSELTGSSVVALVPTGRGPVVHRRDLGRPDLERRLLDDAARQIGECAQLTVPTGVGDPGWAAFHVPLLLDGTRVGTLAALRERGLPFALDERRALRRVAQLAALTWATERYQQHDAQVARMQERHDVSAELHDRVQQLFIDAQLRLDSALRVPTIDDQCSEGIRRARGLVVRGSTAVGSVARLVGSIPDADRAAGCDLPLRLRAALSGIEQEFALHVRLELAPDAARRARQVPGPVADVLVRVAREALVNVAKHAGRCRATVVLAFDGEGALQLTVSDDGTGVREAGSRRRRHGLASLRRAVHELGGVLEVRCGAECGTEVVARLAFAA